MSDEVPRGGVPVHQTAQQVRATVMVPLWNHRLFVEEQLNSLLQQWRPDLELLIIDDASTDDGLSVALGFLEAHPAIRATLMRNERRMGPSLPNIALPHASGSIIIEADSDDIALPNRITRILRCFEEDPACHLVTSNALRISAEGIALGLYDTTHGDMVFSDPAIAAGRIGDVRWLGATVAFRREIFEAFPPIDDEVCGAFLDLLMPFRAALLGTHHYVSEPLVGWRQHSANSHRTSGALAEEGPRAERFRFLQLTVLAQKIRDVQFFVAQTGHESLAPILKICQDLFFETYTAWTRLRLRLERAGRTPESHSPSPYVSAIAPVTTLYPNVRVNFTVNDVGGRAAARSSGFHQPEAWGIWTERHAAISFRLGDESLKRIVVCFAPRLSLFAKQCARILLVGTDWVDFELPSHVLEAEVGIPTCTRAGQTITIVLSMSDALRPADVSPEYKDTRLLGAAVLWVGAN